MVRLRLRVDKLHFQFHSPAGFFVDSTCRIHRKKAEEDTFFYFPLLCQHCSEAALRSNLQCFMIFPAQLWGTISEESSSPAPLSEALELAWWTPSSKLPGSGNLHFPFCSLIQCWYSCPQFPLLFKVIQNLCKTLNLKYPIYFLFS